MTDDVPEETFRIPPHPEDWAERAGRLLCLTEGLDPDRPWVVRHPASAPEAEDVGPCWAVVARSPRGQRMAVALRDEDLLADRLLRSADGQFVCTEDHAADVAYMVNCAEGALLGSGPGAGDWETRGEISSLLADYLCGDLSPEEVRARLTAWCSESDL